MEDTQINREQMYLQIIFEKNAQLLELKNECEKLMEEVQNLQKIEQE